MAASSQSKDKYFNLFWFTGCNNNNEDKGGRVITQWKNPFIVKGPLGIVSGTEVALLLMFIALIIWSFATYLRNDFATITQKSAAEFGEKVWESKLEDAALRLGLLGNMCLAFLFFPVSRASPVLPLLGLTSESCIKYHIWVGHLVLTFFTAHGILYIIFWAATNQTSETVKWDKVGISNVAGEIAWVCGLILWIATIPRIRRKFFELFFYTHYLYILFMVFFIFHVGISFACIMLPGFYIFMVDRFLRFLQSRTQVHLLSARLLPCETLELNFSKTHELSYTPTSVMFINIPSISKLQWHPFTITSSSKLEPEKLSVVIKSEGTWSQKLYKMLSTPSPIDHIGVSVEGPYGPPSTNYLRYNHIISKTH
ncbi:Ferric reduction oxidase 2 [Stylosanthes scabra]|uniref:Ferric reduction oxidase 2 n=1 Tax=Stylosanthes scabra TaxID=79078 RepID=A0ABU6Z084_9FABA|nr:Ferric reduction oxidase 2 [Stylosanthes scabra]